MSQKITIHRELEQDRRKRLIEEELDKFLTCKHERVQDYTECCLDCGYNVYSTDDEIRKAAVWHI